MKSITFTCETITPMFLSGADGQTPELRPPSIKGALRFWWRALHGHLSLEELKKREAAIFGGTESGQGRSSFSISINSNQPQHNKVRKFAPTPHTPHNERFTKNAIDIGFEFQLKLVLSSEQFISLEELKSLFVLTSILGGLGNRNRRAFGVFQILKIDDSHDYKMPSSKDDVLRLITTINSRFQWNKTYNNHNYPYLKDIRIADSPSSNITLQTGQATHDVKGSDKYNYEKFIGNANRFASPVFVSAIKKNDGQFYPIVSILNTANSKVGNQLSSVGSEIQQELINKVLS